MVAEVMTSHALSQRRACGLIGITRRGFQRAPTPDRNLHLRQRLRELAEERRRWGCPMLYLMLRREGWCANHKRVERLYREEGLSLRKRRRRKRLSHLRVARARPVAANQTWAVDFIHDSLISGRHFRAFAVLDEWSRESLAIEVDVSLTGERVTRVLERLRAVRGLPSVIQADNGPELRVRALDQWAYDNGVRPAVHRAGQADPERAHRELQCAAARGMLERARLRLTRRCAQQDRKVACRVQSRTSPFEPRQSDPGGVRGKASDELGHRAHRSASGRTGTGRRGATRSGLGSET
jgi:putative transposase